MRFGICNFSRAFLIFLALAIPTISYAQPLNDLIFTVGTVARSGADDFSYFMLGSASPELLAGKRWAVYGKPGDAASAATFTARGSVYRRSDPAEIDALLGQSVPLGQDLGSLADSLNFLLRREAGISNQPLAGKILTAFRVAATNEQTATFLRMMARVNPGLSLASGQAFTEQIAGVTTYEVRDVNAGTGVPGPVIGRVTLTNNLPLILPAPGAPFQLVTNHPSDNLKVRLRWASTDPLRRLSLAAYGYNIWRLPRAQAEAAGFNIAPPSIAQLFNTANFVRVNSAPVQASKDFPAGANDPSDNTTYFFADDNHGLDASGVAFTDGAEFYYFITARDILGRDGLPSPGSLGRACKRIPPGAPTGVAVEDAPITGLTTVTQRLRISWKQKEPDAEPVTHYWVYRWPNPSMIFSNDLVPLSNRVGVVAYLPGTNVNSYIDDGAGSPLAPGLGVYWYSVRAVEMAACDPLLSPHSAPASGVLRQRDGPDATVGSVLGSCGAPAVNYTGFSSDTDTNRLVSRNYYRLVCDRRDKGIAWAQFIITNNLGEVDFLSPVYFAPDSDHVDFDYSTDVGWYVTAVACIAGAVPEHPSLTANAFFQNPPPVGQRWGASFLAGTILLTAANPADPLLAGINARFGSSTCYPASGAQADGSGTVTMQFGVGLPRPAMVIQGNTNGASSTNWFIIGTATPDSSGVYAISYPACLVGPLPLFRGCVVDLPVEGDCASHITGNSAAGGSVAPIIIKFKLTPRTREYRLYRQVNEGAMSLISAAGAIYNPAKPGFQISIPDDTMPPSAARLCYYVQVLDEHGNGSPLTLLGCKEAGPALPPKPVLAEPVPTGTSASPTVTLNWFCSTSGVSRFQFMIKRVDDAKADTGFTAPGVIRADLVGLVANSVFQLKNRSTIDYILSELSGIHYTRRLSAGFGPGPQFTITANILPDVPYEITVASVNATGDRFTTSETWPFTWTPAPPRVTVPWPARPLPPVRTFDDPGAGTTQVPFAPRVAAVLFTNTLTGKLDDLRYPVAIRIGQFPGRLDPDETIGTTNFIRYYPGANPADADPALYAFHRQSKDPSRAGQSLLPIVVYRQQVTNAAFPRVSSDIVQVTPLIERIPWHRDPALGNSFIPDRLLASQRLSYAEISYSLMYLRDQQPVIQGARYRYLLVRFNAAREIDEVIPAGELEIKYNP